MIPLAKVAELRAETINCDCNHCVTFNGIKNELLDTIETLYRENAEMKEDLKQSRLFDKVGHKLLDISIKDGQDLVDQIHKLQALAKAAEEALYSIYDPDKSDCTWCETFLTPCKPSCPLFALHKTIAALKENR